MTNSTMAQARGRSATDAVSLAIKRFIEIIRECRLRVSSRRELMALDTRDLRDLRLTRADVMKEAGKPFWKE